MAAHFILEFGNPLAQSLEIEIGQGLLTSFEIGVAETVQGILLAGGIQGGIDTTLIITTALTAHRNNLISFPGGRRRPLPTTECAIQLGHVRRWSKPFRYRRCGSAR